MPNMPQTGNLLSLLTWHMKWSVLYPLYCSWRLLRCSDKKLVSHRLCPAMRLASLVMCAACCAMQKLSHWRDGWYSSWEFAYTGWIWLEGSPKWDEISLCWPIRYCNAGKSETSLLVDRPQVHGTGQDLRRRHHVFLIVSLGQRRKV